MEYKYVFLISYVVAFLMAAYFMGQRISQAVSSMKEMGMGEKEIDDYHRMMRKSTILASIQATIITGTSLGLIGSLINYFIK